MSSLSSERSATAGGIILVLRFAAASVLNYLFGVALAWVLVPDAFGTVSALQNVLLLAAGAMAAGLPWALAVKVARGGGDGDTEEREIRTALLGNFGIGMVLAIALVVAQLAGLQVIPTSSVVVTLTVACTLPAMGVATVLAGALQGSRRFGGLGATQSVEILIKCLVGLALVTLLGAGPEGVALGFLTGSLAAIAVAVRALRGILPRRGPLARLNTFRMALPIWVGAASATTLLTADLLGLGVVGAAHGVTASTLAAYQVCAILARAPYFVSEALIDAVFPLMARRESRVVSHGWFIAALRWVPLAIVPLQVCLLLAPGPILRLFFPQSYGESIRLLQLLDVGTLGLLLTNMLVKGMCALGQAPRVARRMPIAVAVELTGLALLVPSFGGQGAATAYCLGAWAGVLLLGPVYLQEQQVSLLPRAISARYAVALAPFAALVAVAPNLPDPAAWALVAVSLVLFVVAARLVGLVNDSDMDPLRKLVAALPARRAAGDLRPDVDELVCEPGFVAPALVQGRMRVVDNPFRFRRDGVLALGCAALAGIAYLYNVFSSPDTVYDEVVYADAARNVATGWHLTWTNQPMFVHPPLSFLLNAAWLRLTGQVGPALIDAVHAARILAATAGAVNVLLVALLAYRLAEHAGPSRRRLMTAAVAAVAALDPVLLRYSRLAIIEPFALLLSLLTLHAAWALRNRRPHSYVPVVGVLTGLALLTKEITILLVVTPVLFATLERDRQMLKRAIWALGVGLGLLLLFPLWSLELGLAPSFLDIQTSTLKRFLGLIQISGWNRPGVSFQAAVVRSAFQYLSSYIVLFAGAVSVCWLWLRRNSSAGNYLAAWLMMSFAFAAYMVGLGTLNEQFFVYVLPASIVGGVFLIDWLQIGFTRRAPHRFRTVRLVRPVLAILAGLGLMLTSSTSWADQYVHANNGVDRITRTIASTIGSCNAINASGDPEKYSYLLGGRQLTVYTDGAAALSRGVHYFLIAPKDAVGRYGNMTPALADWIRAHGDRLAAFPSATYQGVQLWRVRADPHDPLADAEYTEGGLYVNTTGSRCGGFTVTDASGGAFFTAYQQLGGKAVLGSPISRVAPTGESSVQAFDGAVLVDDPSIALPRALPVVADLARQRPELYAALGLPDVVPSQGRLASVQQAAWLTDPGISRTYLGNNIEPTAEAYKAAVQRYGAPLGPVRVLADGWIGQAFAGVVLERPSAGGEVRAASVGGAAIAANLVSLPSGAMRPQLPPPLPSPHPPAQPTTVRPFVAGLALALLTLGVLTAMLRRRRTAEASERTVTASAA